MSAAGYSVVLFDLDHTLLDSDASFAGAYQATMLGAGVADPDAVYPTFDRINQALWRRVEANEISPNDVRITRFRELVDLLGLAADPEEMAETFVDGLIEHGDLYPGARELLEDVAAGRQLALVTNGIGRVQRGRLARLDLGADFDVVTISGEVGTSKPGREIFDLTFDALGVSDRSTAVMVGDSLTSDVAGGVAAGVDTVWFDPQRRGAVQAPDPRPTHVVGSLVEISEVVR